ncbi:MAG: aldo/keto reductase, partial [Phycisphaerales bacterium]|nr:aldo/keto reductase [Phycisphaerales bacterium]
MTGPGTDLHHHRPLGDSALRLSSLTLGCMLFGTRTSVDDSRAMLRAYLEAGGNSLDTANIYGAGVAEETLGQLLRELPPATRAAAVVTTKFHFGVGPDADRPGHRGNHRANVLRSCEDSLRRLGLEHIDLYLAHRPDPDTPIEETLAALDELVAAGKVREVGSSNFSAAQLEAARGAGASAGLPRFVCEQTPFNLLDRAGEEDVIPVCTRLGIGVTAWSPLGGGLLSGKYNQGPPGSTDGRYDLNLEHARQARRTSASLEAAAALMEVARTVGCSPAQLALSWHVQHPGLTSTLIGPRTMEQFHDNLAALGV